MSAGHDDYLLNKPVPYTLRISDELLKVTKQKLELSRYPHELEDVPDEDWTHGSKVSVVKQLAAFWKDRFDWRAQEVQINAFFHQFKVKIDTETTHGTQVIHFAHHRSNEPDAIPLLFVAGWPGSFLEARKLIEPLTSPTGESKHQAFHFVVASIPGFGPGDPPRKRAFGPATTAKAFKKVMVDVLGYDRFVTQGGDVGASITRLMALQYPQHVKAYHLNAMHVRPPAWYKNPMAIGRFIFRSYLYTPQERKNIDGMMRWQNEESGYSFVQRTKPQSLGFGLGDSPIGLLAWLMEKFHGWMDVEHYEMPVEEVLTLVMMHWMQGGTPGFRFYKASAEEVGMQQAAGETWTRANAWTSYLDTPLGYSVFLKELAKPPLDWARHVANVAFYREHDRGGHFAAVECPDLLVQDLREWFGSDIVKTAMRG